MTVEHKKKPEADFMIRLEGGGVKPWSVPMRSLGRVLAAVQRLVDQRDDLVDGEESDELSEPQFEEPRTLRLLSVTSGSAGYAVGAVNRPMTLAVLADTGRSILQPDKADWHPSTISSLDELSQIAKQLSCIIEFRHPKVGRNYGDVLASITPDTYAMVRSRAFRYGRTSVVGRLERVGGATAAKCGVHVQGRSRMLFCNVVGGDLTRELGKYIYTNVLLSGEAVWYRFNDQLKSLTVSSFSPTKTDSFADVARIVSDAGGNAWDSVRDPDELIRQMRG